MASPPDPDDRQPWDRRPDESAKAHQAFLTFRDLGPRRTLSKVPVASPVSAHMVKRWSRAHEWAARATAWDAAQQRAADDARLAARREAVERHAQAAQALLGRAIKLMTDADGAGMPRARSLEVAAAALDKAIHHQRLALGLPTDVTQQNVVVKQAMTELAQAQQTINRVLQEHLCSDCRARVAPELQRVWEHSQRALALLD